MELADTSSYDIVTLFVAIAGFGLALAALGSQAATFVLSGSRVKVDLLRGGIGRGVLITYPPDKWVPENIALMAGQGMHDEEVVVVEVRNIGRMPATVEKVTAYLGNGFGLEPTRHPHAPLAYRLEAGSSEKWWLNARDVRAAIGASGLDRSDVHIEFRLGTGKSLRTRSTPISR